MAPSLSELMSEETEKTQELCSEHAINISELAQMHLKLYVQEGVTHLPVESLKEFVSAYEKAVLESMKARNLISYSIQAEHIKQCLQQIITSEEILSKEQIISTLKEIISN